MEDKPGLSKVAPATQEVVRRVPEQAGAAFIARGVCQSALPPEAIQAIKADIDRSVARGTALMAKYPPLTDDELYDENGV